MKITADQLKFAGGALIVGAAVCIMAPDLVNYIGGLWRLGIMIVVVILVAFLIANVTARFKSKS